MSSNEARAIVQRGLDRRKAERQRAEQAAQMDRQECELFGIIEDNFVCSDAMRRADDALRANREQVEERLANRRMGRERRKKQSKIVSFLLWASCCLGLMWLTTWTQLPIYAAVTFAINSLAVLLAYLYRLDNPVEA